MSLNKEIVNKTTRYILPMFGKYYTEFIENNKYPYNIHQFNFVNVYIQDINKPYYDKHIFIVYETPSKCDNKWFNFCVNLSKHKQFIKEYNYIYNNITYTIFCFEIPTDYIKDYLLILEGRYSEIDTNYKNKILKFWDLSTKSKVSTILFKLTEYYSLYKLEYHYNEVEIKIDNTEIIPEEKIKEYYIL